VKNFLPNALIVIAGKLLGMRRGLLALAATGMGLYCPYALGQTGSSWYVDNAVSGGSHNGTSWVNAWTSFATVNWSSIHAGDTLYISGGSSSKTYNESWTIGVGGTAGAPITIAVDAANPSHNGTVIFDYNADGDASTRVAITVQNYVTITGNVNGANHFQIVNLRNTSDRRASIGISGYGNTGVILDHLTFVNDNNPIRLDYANGVTVRYCNITQLRGDAGIALNGSSGSWDNNKIHDNYLEPMVNSATGGPDGIQGGSGISIYNNTIKEVTTSTPTSNQHPDMMQMTGNFLKVYGNEFINVGDSVFDFDAYANSTPHDIWVYNNIFRIVTAIDPYPEYFRMYCSSGSISSITNVKIMNNTFIDNNDNASNIRMDSFRASPTATGNEIKNNIWYNAGRGTSTPAISIDDSSGFTSSSFSFDADVYYQTSGTTSIRFRGIVYTAPNWIAANEPHGTTAQPFFVSYSPNNIKNNLHLQSGDTVAVDHGDSLTAYFTTDKDGVSRPQGSAWDIGAYEYQPASSTPAPPTNLTVVVQ
jgi:hypothetical protein